MALGVADRQSCLFVCALADLTAESRLNLYAEVSARSARLPPPSETRTACRPGVGAFPGLSELLVGLHAAGISGRLAFIIIPRLPDASFDETKDQTW